MKLLCFFLKSWSWFHNSPWFSGDDLPDFTAVPYQVAWSQSEEVFGRSFFVRKGGCVWKKQKTLVQKAWQFKMFNLHGCLVSKFGGPHYVSVWRLSLLLTRYVANTGDGSEIRRSTWEVQNPLNKWDPFKYGLFCVSMLVFRGKKTSPSSVFVWFFCLNEQIPRGGKCFASNHMDVFFETFLGTNISPPSMCLKMMFLFPFGGIC